MYKILSTNVNEVKSARDNEISIAVLESDIKKGNEFPVLYAFRYGMIYDPNNDFKPNVPKNHKISGEHIEAYYQQLPQARKAYREELERQKGQGGQDNKKEIDELMEALAKKQKEIEAQAKKIEELGKTATNEEIKHESFDDIITLLNKKTAPYLYGPAGTGKSRIAEQVAKELELDFYPASTITQEFKLTGFIDGHGKYHETGFYKAMKRGGVYFVDEMDSCIADVLIGINGALASGYFDFPCGTVYAHKDFKVIGAGNTIGKGAVDGYVGRNELDASTLDRFMAVKVDYSDKIDNAVAKNDSELVTFAHNLRKASLKTDIQILMSYRSIQRIKDFENDFDLVKLMDMALVKGMAKDDVLMLARNMNIDENNKYYKAFTKVG
jgi:cobaltochelatase CobS